MILDRRSAKIIIQTNQAMPQKRYTDEVQIAYLRSIDFDNTLLSRKELAAAMNVNRSYIDCACHYAPDRFVMTAGVATVSEFRAWLRRNPDYRNHHGYKTIEQLEEITKNRKTARV